MVRTGIFQMKIGKCHIYETEITIRNKKTGLVQKIQVGDFHKLCLESAAKDV